MSEQNQKACAMFTIMMIMIISAWYATFSGGWALLPVYQQIAVTIASGIVVIWTGAEMIHSAFMSQLNK